MKLYSDKFLENLTKEVEEFSKICESYYKGDLSIVEYKSKSGGFGTYSEKGHKTGMLRLRIPSGDLNKEQLKFVCEQIEKYNIKNLHFTTNQSIQLHNLEPQIICEIMKDALNVDIITRGSGGDYPRNVLCSPLSGVQIGEYFDVMPYAKAVSNYTMTLIGKVKLPRKLKIGFSNSPENIVHATYRDMGFVAREDKKFDLYTTGGLGPNHSMGIKTAEAIDPNNILYYVKTMVQMFTTYGNYETRAKARTRYIPKEIGEDKYLSEFNRMLQETMQNEELTLDIKETQISKQSDGSVPNENRNIIKQKQNGLYAVKYHPPLGNPSPKALKNLYETITPMSDIAMRISTKEEIFIINLTGSEANKVLDVLKEENAQTELQESVSCVGAAICQAGIANSQGLLKRIIEVDKEENFADKTLPKICISGCQSSCGTQQTSIIGFKGGKKKINDTMTDVFEMTIGGNEKQDQETFGEAIATIPADNIPEMFRQLGREIESKDMTFEQWFIDNRARLIDITKDYAI